MLQVLWRKNEVLRKERRRGAGDHRMAMTVGSSDWAVNSHLPSPSPGICKRVLVGCHQPMMFLNERHRASPISNLNTGED